MADQTSRKVNAQLRHHSHPPARRPGWPRLLRTTAAALVFLGLTAALVDFRELLPVGVGHWLASVQFVPALLAMGTGALVPAVVLVALVLVTLTAGRLYCSVLCPLGILQDLISRASLLVPALRRPLPYARERRLLRHGFVWATALAALAGWGAFAVTLLDPYSNYGRIASSLFRPLLTWANNHVVWLAEAAGTGALYRVDLPLPGLGALLLPALVLTLIVFTAALRGRLWCNTACPVGTLLGWLSRHAAFRIRIDPGACTRCAQCLRACKAQCIDLRSGKVDFSRCVGCTNCLSACDEQGIGYRWSWGSRTSDQAPHHAPPTSAGTPAPHSTDTVPNPGRRRLLRDTAQGLLAGSGLALLTRESRATTPAAPATPRPGGQAFSALPPSAQPDTHAHSLAVAPPGALGIPRFLERCTACQLCISACPKHVLQPALLEYGLRGFLKPRLDFTAGYCDYDCHACAEACPDQAITRMPLADRQLEQIGLACFHEERCIVKVKGTDCAACSEHCPTKAVETIPFGDNLRLPQVNASLCIGCGACQFACPVKPEKAILVAGLSEHRRAVRAAVQAAPQSAAPATSDFPF